MTPNAKSTRRNRQTSAEITVPDTKAIPQAATPMQLMHMQATYQGPLPPPQVLEQYNKIVPGSASLLIDRMVKQSEHRMELEHKVVFGDNWRATAGLILGFIVTLVIIAAAVFLIIHGFRVEGSVLLGMDLVALATAFIHGTNSRRQERQQKMAEVLRREK